MTGGAGQSGLLSLADYAAGARACLPQATWDFIDGGSGDERTLAANERAFGELALHPSALVDVARCDLRRDLLGSSLAVPFGVAPMAFHQLVTPEGECATVRAAGSVGALTVVGIMASRPLKEIAAAATGPLWFQTYWLRDRSALTGLVRQAEDLGYGALVVTVDLPRMARRRRDLRNGFTVPAGIATPNLDEAGLHQHHDGTSAAARLVATQFDPSATWSDLEWLRGTTELPLVVKGILGADDARRATAVGATAVVVSNHGGRQLDGVPASLDVLPEVAAAVGRQVPVLVDGGVRSGADVLKAVALGATAVLVGRPVLWGLAVDGEQGARGLLELLRDELEEAMALSGHPTLDTVGPSLVRKPTRTGGTPRAAASDGPRSAVQRVADIVDRLDHDRDLWLATGDLDGVPHLVPLSHCWDGERVIVQVAASSRTARNAARTGRARLALGTTRDVVLVDATVDTTPVEDAPELAAIYTAHTGWDLRADGTGMFLVLTPVRVQAWRDAAEIHERTVMRSGRWLLHGHQGEKPWITGSRTSSSSAEARPDG